MSETESRVPPSSDEHALLTIPGNTAEDAKLYSEILAAIRTTDDTSFKLLGLVPLVSGLANSGLTILGENGIDPISIVLLSVIGAGITHCLFRWEQRNIQSCEHWWRKLTLLEHRLGFGTLAGRPEAPWINHRRWGKTEAERWIYLLAGTAWLVPIVTVVMRALLKKC